MCLLVLAVDLLPEFECALAVLKSAVEFFGRRERLRSEDRDAVVLAEGFELRKDRLDLILCHARVHSTHIRQRLQFC